MRKAIRTRQDVAKQLSTLIDLNNSMVAHLIRVLEEENDVLPKQFTDIRTLSKEMEKQQVTLRYYVSLLGMLELEGADANNVLLMSDLWDEIENLGHRPKKQYVANPSLARNKYHDPVTHKFTRKPTTEQEA